MASVYYLFDDVTYIEEDILQHYETNADIKKERHFAAVKIQRCYRGYKARQLVIKYKQAIITIQKFARGFLVRWKLPEILHEFYDIMCINYYDKMAAKIQAHWKGIMVRKRIDIKQIMGDKAEAARQNLLMQEQLRKQFEEMRVKAEQFGSIKSKETFKTKKSGRAYSESSQDDDVFQDMDQNEIVKILFDRHHLLRTRNVKGVLSKSKSDELSELEKILNSISWTNYMRKMKKAYNLAFMEIEEPTYMIDDPKMKRQEDLLRLRDKSRDTKVEVVEDKNIHEKPFILCPKVKEKPYERMLYSGDSYSVPQNAILRTEDKSKNICDKDFDLNVLKKVAADCKVPPYYIDFWLRKCNTHNLNE